MYKKKYNEIENLSSFNLTELSNMLNHLKIGYRYLEKLLGFEQLNALLKKVKLTQDRKEVLQAHFQEKAGRISLLVNTIVTSFLGAWLGVSAFNQYHLTMSVTFIILLASIVFGAVIGYLAYKNVINRSVAVLQAQKILKLQQQVQAEIFSKRKQSCEKLQYDIFKTIEKISQQDMLPSQYDSNNDLLLKECILSVESYARHAISNVDNHQMRRFYELNFSNLIRSIENNVELLLKKNQINSQEEKSFYNVASDDSYLYKLTRPCAIAKTQSRNFYRWARDQWLDILTGLMPTILGGFASLFVFLNGFPDIYKHFNLQLFDESLFGYYKLGSLVMVALVTIYFGYAYVHFNYQDYKRSLSLDNTTKIISEIDNEIFQIGYRCNLLTRIKFSLHQLRIILRSSRFVGSLTEAT